VINPPALSLITAVYNKPESLRLVLAAASRQSFTDFELIVADDGSGPAIADVVAEARLSHQFPIIHLWHEDRGWRKNTILNHAVRVSRADHLVFIDGDCLPSRHFLLDHWNERAERKILMGRRVETSERWSRLLVLEDVESGAFEKLGWEEAWDGLRGRSLRVEDGIRIPSRFLRLLLLRNVRGMLGSNFSVARRDLLAINGFDELYNGPGCGEDSDIQYRMSLLGVSGKSLRNLAIQYHIWHPLTKASESSRLRFAEIQKTREARCSHGIFSLA
jgi:glycosyltransferase involved in cell wall biosynthesis